ncbi:MAG: LLM class flavin-dependent oxidoreductase [Candidatus Binatia bacterium]
MWPAYKTRQAQVIEAIDLIRKLWSGEAVTYRGDHYQTQKAKLYTRCDKKIPIFVSAMTPASARFAGTYGDGLITVGGKDPSSYHEMLKNFAAGVDKAIEARKAYWAATFIPALFTQRIYTPTMAEQNGAAVGSDTVRQSVCISADPEVHVRNARHYLDLGFDHLIFHSAGPDQSSFLRPMGAWSYRSCVPPVLPDPSNIAPQENLSKDGRRDGAHIADRRLDRK